MCNFCENYDFSKLKIDVENDKPVVEFGICNTTFSEEEQAKFCPKCGEPLRHTADDKREAVPEFDAQATLRKFKSCLTNAIAGGCSESHPDCADCPYELLTADLVAALDAGITALEQVPHHSTWTVIKDGPGIFDYHFQCEHCKGHTPSERPYVIAPDRCPCCGSIMDGKEVKHNE